mmetsp:Transcript_13309/g.33737  ORF Transcript_13309/g.33737 Transcript_13309/m.33737 type:complete len:159 (+) Transcript_13309:100-576(+)
MPKYKSILSTEPDDEPVSNIEQKIAYFDNFIHQRLQPDLDAACERRDGVFKEIAEYTQLRQNVAVLRARQPAGRPLETRADLGMDFYVTAVVDDCEKIVVDIGLGVFVEMGWDEVEAAAKRREDFLGRRGEALTTRITEIQAHMKLLLNYLAQLKSVR